LQHLLQQHSGGALLQSTPCADQHLLYFETSRPHVTHLTGDVVQQPFDGCAISKVDAVLLHCNLLLPCTAVKWVAGRLQNGWLDCAPHMTHKVTT
jgi:hypothetical protein